MQRWFVPVGPRAGQPIRQFWAEMKAGTTELQNKREMGWPRVLILVEESDGPMLYRYTAEGDYAGDTWHESLTDVLGHVKVSRRGQPKPPPRVTRPGVVRSSE